QYQATQFLLTESLHPKEQGVYRAPRSQTEVQKQNRRKVMKVYRLEKVLALLLLCLCSWTAAFGQSNASAASVSRSRAIVNTGPSGTAPSTSTYYPSTSTYYPTTPTYNAPPAVFRIPDEIAVEEFVNYHKHRLPLPRWGQAVAMDTRWGNDEVSPAQ